MKLSRQKKGEKGGSERLLLTNNKKQKVNLRLVLNLLGSMDLLEVTLAVPWKRCTFGVGEP